MATARWSLLVLFVVLAAVGLGSLAARLSPLDQRPDLPPWARGVGVGVALVGVGLLLWTFRHHPPALMARVTARTIELQMRKGAGGGSAVPRLITTGPYRRVRNPTYLGVLLALMGLGVALPWLGLLAAGLLLLAWWNFVVIPPEERELAERFGEEYERYRARTWRLVLRP